MARRANALVLLDDGMSCEAIAKVLFLDDDTIRTWYRLYEEDGIEGLTNFSYARVPAHALLGIDGGLCREVESSKVPHE